MNYYSYKVDGEFIDTKSKTILWKLTGSGEYIIGTKNKVKYFIKRNINVRKPSKGIDKALFDILNEGAIYIERKQKLLKKAMLELDSTKDKVVTEIENFWDHDNKFVTVTEMIDNLVDSDSFVSYSEDKIIELFIRMMEPISKLHLHNVIHADLKEGNFVFSKEKGEIVPYLIDFDSSFTNDFIPSYDTLVYTDGYQAPEVVEYALSEDDSEKDMITNKIDIFEMGIIFHRIWTGSYILLEENKCSLGEGLCCHDKYIIDKKFNVKIGKHQGSTLMSLINWMIQKDPLCRPSADDVLNVLQDKMAVPGKCWLGDDENLFTGLWDIHKESCELKSVEKLQEEGYVCFKKIVDGGAYKYLISKDDTSQEILTIEEIIKQGIVKRETVKLSKCWDDHPIEFISSEEISKLGYISIEIMKMNEKHMYYLTKIDGTKFLKTADGLIKMGLAKELIKYHPNISTPWEEHGKSFAEEKELVKMKIKSISLVEVGDMHKYEVTFMNEVVRILSYKEIKILGLI